MLSLRKSCPVFSARPQFSSILGIIFPLRKGTVSMSSGQTSPDTHTQTHTQAHTDRHTQGQTRRMTTEKRTFNFELSFDRSFLRTSWTRFLPRPHPLPHLTLGADPPAPSRCLAASVSSVSLLELAGNQSGAHLSPPAPPPLHTHTHSSLGSPSPPQPLHSKSVRSGPSRSISTTSRLIGASTLYVGICRRQS